MFVVENVVEIDRPAAEVFAFVTNPHNIPRWRPIALEVLNVQEPIGVGSTFELVENMMGRQRFGQRVIAHEPDRHHALETTSGGMRPIQDYHLEPTSDGGTRYLVRLEVRSYGWMRVMEPLIRGQVRKRVAEYGQNVKRILETEPR